jgi:archaellum biogenesis ATPase FlaH
MKGKSCRLYDEELVHNIMVSTGLSIVEYIKQFKSVDAIDICEFIENNSDKIIENTIEDMNHEFEEDDKNPPHDDTTGKDEDQFL